MTAEAGNGDTLTFAVTEGTVTIAIPAQLVMLGEQRHHTCINKVLTPC